MRKASVRDLRYRFPEVEKLLKRGHEIEIVKRNKPIARLVPLKAPKEPPPLPDFLGRMRAILGNRVMPQTVAELREEDRLSQ